MQRVTSQMMPVPAGFYKKNKVMRTPYPNSVKQTVSHTADQVHFGKIENLTGPIPPKSLVILVPGMCSPAESMQSLANYLNAKGHSAHVMASPFNIKAGSALASTDWLTHGIDRIRLDEASTRYVELLSQLKNIALEDRDKFLCQKLDLKDNELGKATARAALGLMFSRKNDYQDETEFTKIIRRQRKIREGMGGTLPDETARKQLYSLTAIARRKLHKQLMPLFMQVDGDKSVKKAQYKALEKTIDHVIDKIAPRVVLVGHSMGGFVSMLTLFEQMQDTALVIGLAAPGENGTDPVPSGMGILNMFPTSVVQKGRELLERFGPGIRHMLQGSPETLKLKADHQPPNTTIFAVGMPGDADGLVGEQNFRMNDTLPGRINVLVTPRQANIIELFSSKLHQAHQLIRMIRPYAWAEDFLINSSTFVTGIAHHAGLVQFHDQYWGQSGDIVRGILEAPKNRDGKYDYQEGRPDYAEALQQIRRVIRPFNYEAERLHFLNILHDNLKDAEKEKSSMAYRDLLQAYAPLRPDLEAIRNEQQPIHNGVADKAQELLSILPEAC